MIYNGTRHFINDKKNKVEQFSLGLKLSITYMQIFRVLMQTNQNTQL